MINVAVGDVAIEYEGHEYILRPSFYSMQRIGSPEEIKDVAEWCRSAMIRNDSGTMITMSELSACWHVLSSCCVEVIPESLYGYYDSDESGRVYFVDGDDTVHNLVVIANHLITNGINGKPSAYMMRKSRTANNKLELFDPLDFVASAMVHLGISNESAWKMTMIELQRAIETKYPQDKKQADSMMTASELRELKTKLKGRNHG